MGEYSVGISTKNKIVNRCRSLFYENGIQGTSYEAICSAAGVNRGLIPYYFKSKNNIATIIFQEFIQQGDQLIRELCGDDENTFFICTTALYYDLMKRDPNFCRFYFEIESDAFWSAAVLEIQYAIIDRLLRSNGISIADETRRTIACMCGGVEKELVHGIQSGFLLENAWTIGLRDTSAILHTIGLAREQREKYERAAAALYDKYALYCGPDFSVQLRLR